MSQLQAFRIPALETCPVTGLPIRHSPKWVIQVPGEKPYRCEFSLIGGNIIHAGIDGYSTIDISKQYLDLLDAICDDVLPPDGKIIFMEDYSVHHGTTGEARNYYINRQKHNKRLAGVVFFGASPLFSAIIRVGRLFARPAFPIELANDYAAAVRLALALKEHPRSAGSAPAAVPEIIVREWKLDTGEFAVEFRILPGHVLETRTLGTLTTPEEVEAFSAFYRRVLREWSPPAGEYFRLMDWSGLRHVSWKARGLYMQDMRKLQAEYPCRMAVLFGLGPFVRAVYSASRHFLPIPIMMAATRKEGLSIIQKQADSHSIELRPAGGRSLSEAEVDLQIQHLIDLMAAINWEQTGININEEGLEKAGPFRPLYEALFVLKHDYDEIMQKKGEAETRRHEMEEQLRHAEKMQTIGTLAGGIAHDFNNMLGGITGFASLIKKKFSHLDPGLNRYSDMILDTGKRAGSLVEGLLSFARKSRQETAPVPVHDTIYNLVALLSHTINKSINVALSLKAPAPCILGDRSQIQNSLLNLAVNAADAMPGGGTLTLATRMVTLTDADLTALVYPVPAGEYLEIAVSDTGSGIPPEIRTRIFEPFFTTKETGKGTGLGLANVYGTLQSHSGGIAFESESGRGTTFRLYFKVMAFAPEADPKPETSAPAGSGRILVVDDEAFLRDAVREILTELGYGVLCCADGQEAVETFQKEPRGFDAVLLDMIMPRMGGEECFERLRAINAGIRIIITTGYSDHTQVRALLAKGAAGFLPKPYSVDSISEALQKALKSGQ